MHHGVHVSWTERYGIVGLCWNILKELFGASLHAVHIGDGMFAVHEVHYVEVAHFIIRGAPADNREARWVNQFSPMFAKCLYAKQYKTIKMITPEQYLLVAE